MGGKDSGELGFVEENIERRSLLAINLSVQRTQAH